MLERRSIVCFAHDWEGDPTSKTHIMRLLSARNRILWIGSIGMRRPTASRADLSRLARKVRRGFSPLREVEPNLFVASPLTLPLPGLPMADAWNAVFLGAWLRLLSARLSMASPIVWSFLPNVDRLVGRLGERLFVYHCVDEYSAFSGVPREALLRMERRLVGRADAVLTSSERLRDERLRFNPECFFVSHGVDVAHFGKALDPATRVPEELRRLPRPVIGFFGLLADWVDLDIIRHMALARRDWSFALVGSAATDVGVLRSLPNVHLLGRRPYAELPAYGRGFDVAIVPFRRNDLTLRANPLKLREYLAAGLPVVATPLPEMERYRDLVRFAGDGAGFIREAQAALTEAPEAAQRRHDAMRAESWERRVEEMSAILERALTRKTPCPPARIPRLPAAPRSA